MNRSGHKVTKYNIEFDSLLELDIYEEFLSRGIKLQRGESITVEEPKTVCVPVYTNDSKDFTFKKESPLVRKIEYTPDFIWHTDDETINPKTNCERKGYDVFIEAKGFANETFRYRWKLFKKWLDVYNPIAKVFLVKRRHNGRVKPKDNEARILETKQIVDNIIKIIKND